MPVCFPYKLRQRCAALKIYPLDSFRILVTAPSLAPQGYHWLLIWTKLTLHPHFLGVATQWNKPLQLLVPSDSPLPRALPGPILICLIFKLVQCDKGGIWQSAQLIYPQGELGELMRLSSWKHKVEVKEMTSFIMRLISYPKRKDLLEVENRLLGKVLILCRWGESSMYS